MTDDETPRKPKAGTVSSKGVWGAISIASVGAMRYRCCMRRRPNFVRCPVVDSRRVELTASVSAFALIELLVVVALLLILTTMYWGSSSTSHQRRLQTDCQDNLQKIYIAMQIYANDHAGKFPAVAGARNSEEALDGLVPRYTVDTSVFICPGSGDSSLPSGESFRNRKISYAYYMGRGPANAQEVAMTDRQVDTQSKAAGQYIFSSTGKAPGNNHDKYGGNLLFCDGHVELSPALAPFSLVLTQGVVLLNP